MQPNLIEESVTTVPEEQSQPKIIVLDLHLDKFFDGSRTLEFTQGMTSSEFEQGCKIMFGRVLSPDELGDLIGAPGNSTLHVTSVLAPIGGYALSITVEHPSLRLMWRTIHYRPQGCSEEGLRVVNEDLYVSQTGETIGTKIFARSVAHLIRLGATSTKARCLGNPLNSDNGAYTWAVLGYNARIPALAAARPPYLAEATSLNELMSLPGGQEWWKQNYRPFVGQFDLHPGSSSHRLLEEYLTSRRLLPS